MLVKNEFLMIKKKKKKKELLFLMEIQFLE